MNKAYRAAHAFFTPFFHVFTPFCAHGTENLPQDRPFILCPNHANAADPILVCLSMSGKVPIRVMAKKELMDTPVVGPFLKSIGVFGVDRGSGDIAALKTAIKAVKDGENLLIFPEGTRVKYEGQVQPKGGVAMIALRTGAVMVPVYAGGRKKLFRMTHIVFGEPYEPTTETRHGTAEEYQKFADEVLRRAYELGREYEK
jgi:1-acyl-sn-glycerol-3-phosphate acyltransferase